MENMTAPTALDYDRALKVFLDTDASYAGGLSNHGPMVVEALVSMGVDHWIGPFVEDYRPRLEPSTGDLPAAPADWQRWLRARLADLIPLTANLAGHGLLRVAHAVRGIERTGSVGPSEVQLRELGAAVAYWEQGGPGIDGPPALVGGASADEWVSGLGRLPIDQRADGLLTVTLGRAAASPGFGARVAALAPGPDAASTLDVLATAAAAGFLRNEGLAAFALLHGTTVSSMARVLLPYCSAGEGQHLEAAVATFVAAALVGFDDGPDRIGQSTTVVLPAADALAEMAGASLEDHTIKFADACIGVAARTGSSAPLVALHHQITTPYGLSR